MAKCDILVTVTGEEWRYWEARELCRLVLLSAPIYAAAPETHFLTAQASLCEPRAPEAVLQRSSGFRRLSADAEIVGEPL